MKDLTVKWKNIEYSYRHGLECLSKVATKELIKGLPSNQLIKINNSIVENESTIVGIVNTGSELKIKHTTNNIIELESSWDNFRDETKLKIYSEIFKTFIKL